MPSEQPVSATQVNPSPTKAKPVNQAKPAC
jgi:hypothetical protein